MNIPLFVSSLSKAEVSELKDYLRINVTSEESIIEYDEKIWRREVERRKEKMACPRSGIIPITDFIKNFNMTTRLQNALQDGVDKGRFYYLNEITFHNFILSKNVGQKSWSEFLDIVKEMLSNELYEQDWKSLYIHFKKQVRFNL